MADSSSKRLAKEVRVQCYSFGGVQLRLRDRMVAAPLVAATTAQSPPGPGRTRVGGASRLRSFVTRRPELSGRGVVAGFPVYCMVVFLSLGETCFIFGQNRRKPILP